MDYNQSKKIRIMNKAGKIINAWKQYNNPEIVLNLSNLGLTELPSIPANCRILNCEKNKLVSLPNLLECRELYCNNNMLTSLPELPLCERLHCHHNKLIELPELPMVRRLYCYKNELERLPDLSLCDMLQCWDNRLVSLSVRNTTGVHELPSCEWLICNNNRLISLPYLPKCVNLECSNNYLSYLPEMPECLSIICGENKYLYLNKKQSPFLLYDGRTYDVNYRKFSIIIQRSYRRYMRKKYQGLLTARFHINLAKLISLFII